MSQRRDPWQTCDPQQLVTWRPAHPPRVVEGPLPLALFAGRTLVLELADRQLAGREQDGRLVQVWLGGCPEVAVPGGRDDGGAADPGRLWFLRDDVPLSWRWRQGAELTVVVGGEPHRFPIRGACEVHLADATALYATVLRGLEDLTVGALQDAVRSCVQASLEARLQRLGTGKGLAPVQAQATLEGLAAEDLDDDLAELGLRCVHLAISVPTEATATPQAAAVTTVAPGSYDDLV